MLEGSVAALRKLNIHTGHSATNACYGEQSAERADHSKGGTHACYGEYGATGATTSQGPPYTGSDIRAGSGQGSSPPKTGLSTVFFANITSGSDHAAGWLSQQGHDLAMIAEHHLLKDKGSRSNGTTLAQLGPKGLPRNTVVGLACGAHRGRGHDGGDGGRHQTRSGRHH